MSADEFQEIWKEYDRRLERQMAINYRLMREAGAAKVRVSFNWLIACAIFKIVVGVLWNGFCGTLLWHFRAEPVFVVCAALVILVNSLGIAGYGYQLAILTQIDFEKPVLDTQKRLAQLEASIIRTHRIMVLQTPLYTMFYLNKQMIHDMTLVQWIIQGAVTALFVYGTIVAYRAISLKNAEKGWMKAMLKNEGWRSIARARDFIREIGEYAAEPRPGGPRED